MRSFYLGIDLGSKHCVGAAVSGRGKILGVDTFDPSERNLIDFVKQWPGRVHVMIEECELAGWAYRTLVPHVDTVIVSDPKINAWISKSSFKDDKVDAMKLARLNRSGDFKEVYNPKREKMAAFKKAVRQHQVITRKVAALKAQLKSQFRREGVMVRGADIFSPEKEEESLGRIKNGIVKELIAQNLRLLDLLEKERLNAKMFVMEIARNLRIIRSLKKVPGVGLISAARFIAHIQTPHRFTNKRKVWQYCRYGIVDRSSDGAPLGRKKIDRFANGTLKNVGRTVFNGAMKREGDNLFKRFYRSSQKRTGNQVHARLNTERKIIAVMWSMWRNGTEYDDNFDDQRA